jgi:hypothetical protein
MLYGKLGEKMENLSLIIALLGSALTIVAAMIAMMLWVRSEANADRRDIVNLIIAIKEDVHAIQLEMRDFHTRLCSIEERRRKNELST